MFLIPTPPTIGLNMVKNGIKLSITPGNEFKIIFRAFKKKLEHILSILSFFQKNHFLDNHVQNILRIFEIQ